MIKCDVRYIAWHGIQSGLFQWHLCEKHEYYTGIVFIHATIDSEQNIDAAKLQAKFYVFANSKKLSQPVTNGAILKNTPHFYYSTHTNLSLCLVFVSEQLKYTK